MWGVLREWFSKERDASIIMLWEEVEMPGGRNAAVLWLPPIDPVEVDGIVLSRKNPCPSEDETEVISQPR